MITNLFGLGLGGKSATVSAQKRVNMYAELSPEPEKGPVALYGTPGLVLDYSYGDTPVRGSIVVGDFKYEVHRGTFWQVNNAGIKTNRGTLATTSGRVRMTYNGTQIAFVDGTNYYVYTITTNAFAVTSLNLVGIPIDITFGDSYGILGYADGKFQITASYNFTTLDALDFATAESNPDGLVRLIYDHGELVLLGSETVEFWGNTGGTDFPYTNQRGTTLEFGLAAANSLVKYNDSLAGVFKNKMGQVQVMMMQGHALVPLSSQEHSSIINDYAAVSDATAFAYMRGGHPMLQVNFPTAGKSWLYDASTKLWSELQSGLNGGRHLAEIHVDYLNKPRVTDYANGNVYTLDADTYTDNGQPIVRELVSRHLLNDFDRFSIARLAVDFETGVGLITGQGSDPQVMLQVSKDNGHTWGMERWTAMGRIGTYLSRCFWTRLGSSRDWTFRLRITDPVKVVITSTSVKGGGQ